LISEINNDVKLDLTNRPVSINPDDYKENDKFEFLAKYLNGSIKKNVLKRPGQGKPIDILNQDDDKHHITSQDIAIFLQDKKLQKKGITEDDVAAFLKKVEELNPTKEEIKERQMSERFKDENGNTIMTDELKEAFGLKHSSNSPQFYDNERNVKKGFEVFDLNGDGKIDKYEDNIHVQYGTLNDLEEYLTQIDRGGSDNAPADGVISAQDRQTLYIKKIAEESKALHKSLNEVDVKDESGNDVITPEVKALFSGDNTSTSYNNVVDENGNIKPGMELFDLNGDKKLDDYEKAYFSSGGHAASNNLESLNIESLIAAVKSLDSIEYYDGYAPQDGQITAKNKEHLYAMLGASYYMLENIDQLPEDLQSQYKNSLKEIFFKENISKGASGVFSGSAIAINSNEIGQAEMASVIIHELTHHILSKTGMENLLQEVETFYMEYKLHKNAKANDSKYDTKFYNGDRFHVKYVDEWYMQRVDSLKAKHPEMSEKDIAVEVFLLTRFDSYNGRYRSKVTPDYMRNASYESLYGIFDDKPVQ